MIAKEIVETLGENSLIIQFMLALFLHLLYKLTW